MPSVASVGAILARENLVAVSRMSRRLLALFIPALLVVAVVASGVIKVGAPLAMLGKTAIRETDFQSYLESTYPPEKVEAILRNAADRDRTLEEYLDSQALLAKARQQGIDREPRFKKALELMQSKILSHLFAEHHRDRVIQASHVSDDEIHAYYEQHKHEFKEQPRFTAYHLLVYVKGNPAFPEKGQTDTQARAQAMKALSQLRAGKGWDAVVKTYSDEITTNPGGLIRDGQFGFRAPEVESAIKNQPLGKPGTPIRSAFGYHVVQVEDRALQELPKPFEQVKEIITERLTQARAAEVQKSFMEPLREAVGFKLTEAGKLDASLLDDKAVAPNEILAELDGKKILESDFRWFLKDAFIPKQRTIAYSRLGARLSMLTSYLDMLVLEAKARKEGLDKSSEFARSRLSSESDLLIEFLKARDKAGPFSQGEQTEAERIAADRQYVDHVRAEVGLKVTRGRH
jgi:peptidyl-prolyl cis-trans isomerase C